MNPKIKKIILEAQKKEITEYYIYCALAKKYSGKNREVLEQIANEEKKHFEMLKKITKQEVKPSKFKIGFYTMLAKCFGLNFTVHLMERGEQFAQKTYKELAKVNPTIKKILKEEEAHEEKILKYVDKSELTYAGSVVLGLNDALVELTGSLAGLTLALQETRLIAFAGFLVGFAASLSMAASEFLSQKEEGGKKPLVSSMYTGVAYFVAVIILLIPYLLTDNALVAFATTMTFALLIIFTFTFYTAVARNLNFKRKFLQMAGISLGVAALNFAVASLIKMYMGI